jgi:GNAT superfamily N-acetyltransferase
MPDNLNTNDIKIRKVEVNDIPNILMIEKLANISNLTKGKSNLTLEKTLYTSYQESKNYYLQKLITHIGFVVEYDMNIIGCGFLIENTKSYTIQTVYIEPSFQSQGIGRLLIEFLIQKAKNDNKEYLELETATAIEFYHKLGFIDVPDTFKMIFKLK